MATDRRTVLTFAAAGGASVLLSASPGAAFAVTSPPRTRVYVLVVDGCRPDEITTTLTPRLAALRAAGTNYPSARSLPVMETIPNHVMMMTGVRPDRSGVPANSIFDGTVVRDMDQMADIKVATLLERLKTRNLRTGSVLSKKYLFGHAVPERRIAGSRRRFCPAPITRPINSRSVHSLRWSIQPTPTSFSPISAISTDSGTSTSPAPR